MNKRIVMPKISVVMSAYNAEKYLDDAIMSILNQTLKDFEFIIIDDGSSDNTNRIIREYAKKDPRIVLIIQRENAGLIAALNLGFRLSQGKYIARMDADDISTVDRLKNQYEYLESHPDTVIVGALSAYMNSDGHVEGVWPVLIEDSDIRTGMALHNEFRHGVVMIRNKVIKDNEELYDSKALYYEDYEYWPRLMRYGKGANLPQVLYLYRQSKTSITAAKSVEMYAGSQYVMAREKSLLKLPAIHAEDIYRVYRRSSIYKPRFVYIGDKKIRTNLRWQYQLHLLGLSRLYIQNKKLFSALYILMASVLVNPIRFVYSVFVTCADYIKKPMSTHNLKDNNDLSIN